ncbi:MAG TPA: hypothetical protein VNT51_12190 [Miltoncostaeaceae bacterium]|jgi:hypothetical protein|nr:hypothetical protein [Miltoncostaeaceae bacterium]
MDITADGGRPGVPRDEEAVRRETEERSPRQPDQGGPLDQGSPEDPDRPTDAVWEGNTLREPGPGSGD